MRLSGSGKAQLHVGSSWKARLNNSVTSSALAAVTRLSAGAASPDNSLAADIDSSGG